LAVSVTGPGAVVLSDANTYTAPTTVTSGALIVTNTSGSATGTTSSLTVNGGATLAGTGASSGSAFSISGTGTTTSTIATVLVGQNAATAGTDTNTTSTLTLTGSTGISTISNANLVFNLNTKTPGSLNSDPSGSGNELNVVATNISFSNKIQFTLNLQNEPSIIAGDAPSVLIAGTGTTNVSGGSGSTTTGQYAGLVLGNSIAVTGGTENIITGINGGSLSLLFGNSTDTSYYGNGNSYLVLYENTGGTIDDIDVEVVPEPSTWAMMLGGLLLLVLHLRRRGELRPSTGRPARIDFDERREIES
jgi:hypothetical protein